MHTQRTEAIVLQVINFKEFDLIATLFTADCGLIKVVGPRARSSRSPFFGCFQPLNLIEIEFRQSGRDLERAENASLLDAHISIRQSFEHLQAGCTLLTSIAHSQMLHKPAPLLYLLLKKYLSLLSSIAPEIVQTSFQLKLLRHDGLLSVTNRCADCQNEPEEIALHQGQVLCATHRQGLIFSKEETTLLYALALTTSPTILQELTLPPGFTNKIETLFRERD